MILIVRLSFHDGRIGILPIQMTADGLDRQTLAGRNATINDVVTFMDGVWTETEPYVMKEMPPVAVRGVATSPRS